MIDHLMLRVRNAAMSKAFFLAALRPLGYELGMEFGESCGLKCGGHLDFWLAPGKQEPIHVAFRAPNRRAVDAFYEAALKVGGKDNGKPGLRTDYHPNYYGAFVLDLDGNNIEAVCHEPG